VDLSHTQLGEFLQKLRNDSGATQQELGLAISKSQSYVSKLELGEKKLTFIEVLTIIEYFELSCNEFISNLEGYYHE
jgi:transcriptional regulator with XRE-family HTH domain